MSIQTSSTTTAQQQLDKGGKVEPPTRTQGVYFRIERDAQTGRWGGQVNQLKFEGLSSYEQAVTHVRDKLVELLTADPYWPRELTQERDYLNRVLADLKKPTATRTPRRKPMKIKEMFSSEQ